MSRNIQVEEAVQDVKRTAMAELQRALAAERLRSERLAAEARRQGAEETLLALGGHNQIKEVTIKTLATITSHKIKATRNISFENNNKKNEPNVINSR